MTSKNIELICLKEKISILNEDQLSEINELVESFIDKSSLDKNAPDNLRGIWKNIGFEEIDNLQEEIKKARRELSDSILREEF